MSLQNFCLDLLILVPPTEADNPSTSLVRLDMEVYLYGATAKDQYLPIIRRWFPNAEDCNIQVEGRYGLAAINFDDDSSDDEEFEMSSDDDSSDSSDSDN